MGRGDRGSIVVLEAILVALLVFGAIAFLYTLQQPARPTIGSQGELSTRASDALRSLVLQPALNESYENALAEAVTLAAAGDCSLLSARLRTLLPLDTRFGVRVETGGGGAQLCGETPLRSVETASATTAFQPKWSYLAVVPRFEPLDGASMTGRFAAAGVHHSNLLYASDTVTISLDRARPHPGAEPLVTTFVSSHALAAGSDGPYASVSLLDALGAERGLVRVCGIVNASAGCGSVNATLHFRVTEWQGRAIPAGTTLEVRLPRHPAGFLEPAPASVGPASQWNNVSVQDNGTHWLVRARLAADLSGASVPFHVTASANASNRAAFHVADVRWASPGVRGGCACVVELLGFPWNGAVANPLEGLHARSPTSTGAGAEGLWTATYVNPTDDAVTLERARLAADPQRVLALRTASVGDGSWGGTLAWTFEAPGDWIASFSPPLDVDARSAVDLVLGVTGSPRAAPPPPDANLSILFAGSGHLAQAREASVPGVRETSVPWQAGSPGPGYPTAAAVRSALSQASWLRQDLPGNASYRVHSGASAFANETLDAAASTTVRLDARAIFPGQAAYGVVDARRFLRLFHDEVDPAGDCVAPGLASAEPLAVRCTQPSGTVRSRDGWRIEASHAWINVTVLPPVPGAVPGKAWSSPVLGAEVLANGTLRFSAEVASSALWGPYLVVAEATVRAVNEGDPSTSFPLTVRAVDTFVVAPPGRSVPASPIYQLELFAWREG
ncbi:MAG TPA: hypothetical protein VM681_00105 [Candidatus Thermoplasmatota archaeon]|nr:hypothetical protein [Candidatus Thermoplasmatota archaeon]